MSTVFRIIAFNFHFSGELFVVDSFRSTFGRVDGIILGVLLAFFLNKRSIDLGPKIESKLNVILAAIFIVFVIILFTVSETNAYLNNGGFIITNFLCVFTILIAVKNLAISSFQIKFFVG